jgi:lipopolysaccharide biosynthesis glycosyltransferase
MLASAADVEVDEDTAPGEREAPSKGEVRDLRRRLTAQRAKASFVDALARGETLEQAITELVRGDFGPHTAFDMRRVCEALASNTATATAGELGWALVATHFGVPAKAWHHFSRVPAEVWQRWAAPEFFETALKIGDDEVVAAASRLLEKPPDTAPTACWLAVTRATFGVRRYDLSRRAHALAGAAARHDPSVSDATRAEIDWLDEWLGRLERPSQPPLAPTGGVSFGVLDYKQPDRSRASNDTSDFLQTIAALGHLARHRAVEAAGPPDLVDIVSTLRDRVDDSMIIGGANQTVTLVPVNRDASTYDELPDVTWLLACGQYVQDVFGSLDFPLNPRLRPIFISFNCAEPRLLTPDAVAYLRRYGPIGCRDWTTVYLLHSVGVPAFFSGCITTTIDTVVGGATSAGPRTRRTALVDMADSSPWPNGVRIEYTRERIRESPLVANLTAALELLDELRGGFDRIVTTRLHCYLPARSVGASVEFAPRNRADTRLNGLLDIDDAAFAAMRQGINDKLASTVSLILSGADTDEVGAHWRKICAADVRAAQQRIADVASMPPPSFDVEAACNRIRSERTTIATARQATGAAAVDVAVALDGGLRGQLGVVLEGLVTAATRPVHMWILSRDHGPVDFDRLARAFPDVTFTWLPCDHVDYGDVRGVPGHITNATLDRLLLPDLLDELDRVVYLDIDVLPLGDVAELASWDLGGVPLAATSVLAEWRKGGYSANIRHVATRLRGRAGLADDLLRRMCSIHPYDFVSFHGAPLVLDLARMRSEEFCRRFIPFVEVYGMNDMEVLNIYAGSRRVALPPEWNLIPSHAHLEAPKLIHWAGPVKPWAHSTAPLSRIWRQYEDAYADRLAKAAEGSAPT